MANLLTALALALGLLPSVALATDPNTPGIAATAGGVALPICRIGAAEGVTRQLRGVGSPAGICGKAVDGALVAVIDAATKGDCSTGGGTAKSVCQYDSALGGANKWSPALTPATVTGLTNPLGANLDANGKDITGVAIVGQKSGSYSGTDTLQTLTANRTYTKPDRSGRYQQDDENNAWTEAVFDNSVPRDRTTPGDNLDYCFELQKSWSTIWRNTSSTSRASWRMSGRPPVSVPLASFHTTPGGERKVCAIFANTQRFLRQDGTDPGAYDESPSVRRVWPACDALTAQVAANMTLNFDNVLISTDTATQSSATVLFEMGEFYCGGWTSLSTGATEYDKWLSGASGNAGMPDSLTINGLLEFRPYNNAGGGPKADGHRPADPTATTFQRGTPFGLPFKGSFYPSSYAEMGQASTTSMVTLLLSGMSRTSMDGLRVRCRNNSSDYDDVCVVSIWNMMGSKPRIHQSGGGSGLVLYGDTQGNWPTFISQGSSFGVVTGDPWNGGDTVTSPYCGRGYEENVSATGATPVAGDAVKITNGGATVGTGYVLAWTTTPSPKLRYRLMTGRRADRSGDTLAKTDDAWSAGWSSNSGAYCGQRNNIASDIGFTDMESNEDHYFSDVVCWDCTRLHLTHQFMEHGNDSSVGAGVYLGAGACYADTVAAFRPCWQDADCTPSTAGACAPVPIPTYGYRNAGYLAGGAYTAANTYQTNGTANGVRVDGGQSLGTKNGTDPNVDSMRQVGIALGPDAGAYSLFENNANEWGALVLNTPVSSTDTNPAPNNAGTQCSQAQLKLTALGYKVGEAISWGTAGAAGTGIVSFVDSVNSAIDYQLTSGARASSRCAAGANVGLACNTNAECPSSVCNGLTVTGAETAAAGARVSGGNVDCRPFVAHKNSRMIVDLRQTDYRINAEIVPTSYRAAILSGEQSQSAMVNDADFGDAGGAVQDCISWSGTLPVLCTSPEAERPIGRATWLKALRVVQRGAAVPAARSCDLKVQIRRGSGTAIETVSNVLTDTARGIGAVGSQTGTTVDHVDYGATGLRSVGDSFTFDIWRHVRAGDSVRVLLDNSAAADCANGSGCTCNGAEGLGIALDYAEFAR